MSDHAGELLISLAFYIILFISYLGWGYAVQKLFKLDNPYNHPEITLVWMGWAFNVLILGILHIFFPLKVYIIVSMLLFGIIFSIRNTSKEILGGASLQLSKLQFVSMIFITLAIASWVAARSMLSPTNYDSGLYHFQSIRWINSYSIIPGLGNLHGRLAFNQSFFLYVAALNLSPLFNNGHSIANSFLFLLTLATVMNYLLLINKKSSTKLLSHPFKFLPSLFILPIICYIGFFSDGLSSPSPDFSSEIIQIVIFLIFIHNLNQLLSWKIFDYQSSFLLSLLSATLITIKLSNLIYAIVIIAFVLVHIFKSSKKPILNISRTLILPALIIVVWCARGFILSGAPLYPSTIGYLPVEWAVSKQSIISMANTIYSWARQPNAHWRDVLGSWDWLKPWLTRNSIILSNLLLPIGFSTLALAVTETIGVIKKKYANFYEYSILLPLVLPLVFWFFTAPSIRFATAYFFLFPVVLILLLLTKIQQLVNKRWFIIIICITFLMVNFQYLYTIAVNINYIGHISHSGYQQIPEVPLIEKVTESGLLINIPVGSDQCWDAPLPCAPNFYSTIELRKTSNLSAGFLMVDKDTVYDH